MLSIISTWAAHGWPAQQPSCCTVQPAHSHDNCRMAAAVLAAARAQPCPKNTAQRVADIAVKSLTHRAPLTYGTCCSAQGQHRSDPVDAQLTQATATCPTVMVQGNCSAERMTQQAHRNGECRAMVCYHHSQASTVLPVHENDSAAAAAVEQAPLVGGYPAAAALRADTVSPTAAATTLNSQASGGCLDRAELAAGCWWDVGTAPQRT